MADEQGFTPLVYLDTGEIFEADDDGFPAEGDDRIVAFMGSALDPDQRARWGGLFATAPKLYEALEAVVRTKDEYDTYAKGGVMAAAIMDPKEMRARGNAAFEAARAALSLARGDPS